MSHWPPSTCFPPRPPKQHVYEAALATLQRAEEEEARAEAAVTARDGGGTAAMVAAAELRAARLRIARQDLAALRPDTRMLSQARIGIVECAQVFLAAAAAGGYWVGAVRDSEGNQDPFWQTFCIVLSNKP